MSKRRATLFCTQRNTTHAEIPPCIVRLVERAVGRRGEIRNCEAFRNYPREAHSVTLEDEFWQWVKEIARDRGIALQQLVNLVDQARQTASLSSAFRIFVLEFYKERAALHAEHQPKEKAPPPRDLRGRLAQMLAERSR